MPPNLDEATKPKKGLLRYLRWRDLIVVALGVALGLWVNGRFFRFKEPTDYQKWQIRPKLDPGASAISQQNSGRDGLPPCFFMVPPSAVDQPVVSGSVGDCLLLVPDGKNLDLFELSMGGLFTPVKTDLYVPGALPLAFTRSYAPQDTAWARSYRIFLPHVYDPYLTGSRFPYTYLDWRLPDGWSIRYGRISPGTGYADAIYEHSWPTPVFKGSRIGWNGWGWDLSLEDGTTYLSPEAYNSTRPQQGSLVGIFDKDGNEIRLSRRANGDLAEIKAADGRWIRLGYDKKGRTTKVEGSSGDAVQYDYDSDDRLELVRHSSGQTEKYRYDSSNRIVRVDDFPAGTNVEIKYGSDGAIERITGIEGTFNFQYHRDKLPNSGHVDIIDSRRRVTRVGIQTIDGRVAYTVGKLELNSP